MLQLGINVLKILRVCSVGLPTLPAFLLFPYSVEYTSNKFAVTIPTKDATRVFFKEVNLKISA